MKGYWHFLALSVVLSILTVTFDKKSFIIVLLLWLYYLYQHKKIGLGSVFLSLVFYIGFCSYIPSIEDNKDNLSAMEQAINGEIEGTISSPVKTSAKKIEFVIQERTSNHKLLVSVFKQEKEEWNKNAFNQLKHGATCHLTGLMELPDQSRNPGQFDYRSYLQTKGISYQLTLSSLENITCEGSSYLNSIFETRLSLINFVISKTDPYTAKWLSALILGDDSHLDKETIELFQKWNLSHLLAISGLNVAIIIAITYFLLIKLNLFTKEKAQWLMIVILPLYALIAGGEPSVWRACLMVFVLISLRKLNTVFTLTDGLSIIFLLMILFDKFIVYHIGFQLSFLVTFGLLLSAKWIASTQSSLMISLQISFMAQMMIIPLQLAYFYTFQPLSMLVNVIIIPYFSFFVIPIMFIILLLSPFSNTILSVLNTIFESTNQAVIYFIHVLDQVAYFPYILGPLPFMVVLLYYVLFLLLMDAVQREKKMRAMKIGLLTVCLITFIAIKPYLSPYGTVTMLDIGQGDSFIIELPYRKAVFFIDAGAKMSFENKEATDMKYEQVIKPFLYANGIAKINALFVTHEDVDHVGSAPFLLEDYKVDRVFLSDYYQLPSETINKWKQKGILVQRLQAGNEIDFHGYPIQILSPHTDKKETNANSLVLHMNLGGLGWLFTGDIDKQIEKELVKKYPGLTFDVLKVAHHGSDTSTDKSFIEQYKPKYAWISVGENNSYGHPTKDVLDVLEDEGTRIFRTDQDGAVEYHFKKETGTFLKYLP
ncbi:DNA internalization-related competence protein ComEC/Rec2 [Virgibacillus necropolis]|uniref:DNA internalization-related competence protein ComEC/Rec2 n=1 Tax=Virgibacillus necropolis TaxID=163877 RepID=A0A221MC34_9BACI|nr:DNA internalization-related competence protein ComEC/Rec2 [Virgibacillus necropolis]ASN05172.1 DNA internalization-related competence protein ComEC/Rec2 [Virgibacillus necropolis]